MEVSGGTLPPGQSSNMLAMLLQGRKPEEIKQIVDSLDEASLDKLAYLATAMNGQQLGMFTQTLRRPETNVKETIELINTIVKMNQKQPEATSNVESIAKSMADMFKTGVEVGQGASKAQPQESRTDKYLDLLVEELKAARQENQREREARLEKEIEELRRRPGLMDELAGNTEKFQQFQKLFGTPGGKSEIDLKLAEMAQTERLEGRKLDWEVQKHGEDKEDMKQIYGLIGKAIDGPISDFTKGVGAATAKRIESGARKSNTPQIMQIPCPACHQSFDAISGAPQVICPHCKSVLALQTQAPEQPSQSVPQQESPPQASEAPQPAPEQPEQPK
jgi:hypothetical protein